jgi:hypothetical protein
MLPLHALPLGLFDRSRGPPGSIPGATRFSEK